MGLKEGWERFTREISQTITEKFHQGRDELANALFSGRAYMPWPGMDNPTLHQQAEKAVNLNEEIGRVEAARSAVDRLEPNNFESHANAYGVSYEQSLNEAAQHTRNDNDRGPSR